MTIKHPEPIHALDAAAWLRNRPSRNLTDGTLVFGVIDSECLFMTSAESPAKTVIGDAYFERFMLGRPFYDYKEWRRYQSAQAQKPGQPPLKKYEPIPEPLPPPEPEREEPRQRLTYYNGTAALQKDAILRLKRIDRLLLKLRDQWLAEPFKEGPFMKTVERLVIEAKE